MAVDLEAIKAKLALLNKSNTGGTSESLLKKFLWKPTNGTNRVRIIPYIHRRENPFLEVYTNYNIASYPVVSRITYGQQCPINDFAERLKSTGVDEDWKLARKVIEPKMRVYVPILVRGRENEGPKFWGFGTQVYQQICQFMADDDYGDITDLANGRDIVINYDKPEGAKPWEVTTIVLPKPAQTPATDSQDVVEMIKKMPTMEDLFPPKTFEELENILKAYANNESEQSESGSDKVTEGVATKDGEGSMPKTSVEEATDMFENFLKDI